MSSSLAVVAFRILEWTAVRGCIYGRLVAGGLPEKLMNSRL
jgi:hypothetical protein